MAMSMDLKVSAYGAAYRRNQKQMQNDVNAAQSFFGVLQNTTNNYSVDEAGRDKLWETYAKLTETSKDILQRIKKSGLHQQGRLGRFGQGFAGVGCY